MSSSYVANFLNAEQRLAMQGHIDDHTMDDFVDECYEDGTLCIGVSTDAWVYMACRAYLQHHGCVTMVTATPFGEQLWKSCDFVDLYISEDEASSVLERLHALASRGEDPIPFIRQQLEAFEKPGYVKELEYASEDYLAFFESFQQHVAYAAENDLSIIIFLPY